MLFKHTVLDADVIHPPFFEKIHKTEWVMLQHAPLPDDSQLVGQLFVQPHMGVKIGETAAFQKVHFYFKMYFRIIVHHIDNRDEHIGDIVILYAIVQRIDDGDYAPVLLVDYGYSQVVFGFPCDKNIMLEMNV